jgi:hypoxia-inducible factor prolyl hydroxylase
MSVPSIRGDKVIWMCGGHDHRTAPEGESRKVKTKGDIEPCRLQAKARAPMRKFAALKDTIKACDALMDEMKKTVKKLEKIYSRSDAMLANYPGGGSRFARHIDNTTNDGRRITLLIYLNPSWNSEVEGGALRLTPQDTEEGIDVFPECGRLAMFYSADMPHEVMPTYGDRHAITLWYYDMDERQQAIKDAKESGAGEAVNAAGSDAQREAKEFISDLMGGDEVDADGGDPSQEELTALCNKVEDLSDNTLGVVASITGAPSTSSFREGFTMLTPTDLKQMRQLFRRMGLASE